jgi:hypothetical protein
MVSGERLREMAHKHRANAKSCPDRNLSAQFLELAAAYEALADSRDRMNGTPSLARPHRPSQPVSMASDYRWCSKH